MKICHSQSHSKRYLHPEHPQFHLLLFFYPKPLNFFTTLALIHPLICFLPLSTIPTFLILSTEKKRRGKKKEIAVVVACYELNGETHFLLLGASLLLFRQRGGEDISSLLRGKFKKQIAFLLRLSLLSVVKKACNRKHPDH